MKSTRAALGWFVSLVGLALTAGSALAATPEDPAGSDEPASAGESPEARAADAAPDHDAHPDGKKKKQGKKKPQPGGDASAESGFLPRVFAESANAGRLEVHGRLFARAAFSRHYVVDTQPNGASHENHVDALDVGIPTARMELYYRAPVRWLSADVELELADKPELKDAWIRAKNKHFFAKIGQYKSPFSAIELESRFALPTADRGVLHDLIVDELQIAGRRPGFSFGARTRGPVDLGLVLGAFQGSVLTKNEADDRDVDLLSEESLRAQSLFARVELGVGDVTFGLGYEHRVGTPEVLYIEHYPTFGADATLDTRVLGRGLRIWVEGMAGASWYEHSRKPTDDKNAVFSAGRLVVAPRIGGLHKYAPYLEPYGMVGLFDPDTEVAEDLVYEESLGVNAGFWRLARLGLEFQLSHFERNFPAAYGLGKNPDQLAVLLQAGAEF